MLQVLWQLLILEIILAWHVTWTFQCTVCGKMTKMTTSKQKRQCHEINLKANLAMAELGQGREAMATLGCE